MKLQRDLGLAGQSRWIGTYRFICLTLPQRTLKIFLESASRRASTSHGDPWPSRSISHFLLSHSAVPKSSFDRRRSGIAKHSAAVCRRPSPGDDRPAALALKPNQRDHILPLEDTNDLRQQRLERNPPSRGRREENHLASATPLRKRCREPPLAAPPSRPEILRYRANRRNRTQPMAAIPSPSSSSEPGSGADAEVTG